jgi:polyisoprenoid-binding protein YceI
VTIGARVPLLVSPEPLRTLAVLGLLAACAGHAGAQAVPALSLTGGTAAFRVRTTVVNDFTGTVAAARAQYTGTDLASVQGFVEFPVAEMRTGIGLRDRHTRAALAADSFPLIRFDLTGVEPAPQHGDTVPAVFRGRLTIRGVTREVHAPGAVVLDNGALEIAASLSIDIREYGITPPVRMLGALRVAPDISVKVHLVFGAAAAPD